MKRQLFAIVATIISIYFVSGPSLATPPPVEAYAQLPGIYDASLSPDGKDLAVIVENDGAYIVRIFNIADTRDQRVRATTFAKSTKPLWIKWISNKRLLLSVQGTQHIGNTIAHTGFLYSMNRDAENLTAVIRPSKRGQNSGSNFKDNYVPQQFNNIVYDFLYDDPDHILMGILKETNSGPSVFKVNINTGSKSFVRRGEPDIQSWITDGRGEVRVGQGQDIGTGKYKLSISDAETGYWHDSKTYPGLTADENIVGFMENPNEMIVARYQGHDTLGLYIYDLEVKKLGRELFRHPQYDVENVVRSGDGKKVIGAQYVTDVPRQEIFDPKAKLVVDNIKMSLLGYTLRYYEKTPDNERILFKASRADSPGRLMLYDGAKGIVRNFGSDYPKLKKIDHGPTETKTYKSRDGQEIQAFVTLPYKASGKKAKIPFIVLPHGGPYARDMKSFDYLVQFLSSRGYGVLQMNFRGSTGFGRKFEQEGRNNWTLMQDDVEDGTKWLISQGMADPDRIAIMGWSYGGYAALMGGLKTPELYKSIISIAGVTDLRNMINDIQRYQFGRLAARSFILNGFKEKDDIKNNSPTRLAEDLKIPLFLAHGTSDTVVHFDHFTRMKKAAKKGDAKVTALKLKDGDHSLADFENRLELLTELEKFLIDTLGPSQYAL